MLCEFPSQIAHFQAKAYEKEMLLVLDIASH